METATTLSTAELYSISDKIRGMLQEFVDKHNIKEGIKIEVIDGRVYSALNLGILI